MSMPAKNERIRESLQENDMTNYKGIYFGGDNEQAYYEGGAHFRYKDLCSKLEKIVLSLTPDRRGKSMYEDYTYSSVKEVSSVERTKPETRKVLSECSKDTYSENKSTHISPGPGNRARGEKEVSRNVKRHNVSQEKQGSYCANSFQSKVVINTLKTNKVHNNNMTKQYIKKINPNFVVSNSKPKENKFGYVDVKKTMKARILEINEKDSFSQQKQAMNISTLKIQNNNNIYPISTNSKATTDSIPSRRFFTQHNGSMSKKSENSRMTIEKSFKQSMDSSTPSDLKSDTRRKNELLQSSTFKSRNLPKFDLFKSANKDTKSLRNYSIENPRNVSSSFNKSTPPSIISKTVHKITQAKTHFSQFNKVSMPSKKSPSPMNNRLVSRQSNQNKDKIGLKGKYGIVTKPRNTSLNTKDRKSESVNKSGNTKVFSTTFNATFNPASFKQK